MWDHIQVNLPLLVAGEMSSSEELPDLLPHVYSIPLTASFVGYGWSACPFASLYGSKDEDQAATQRHLGAFRSNVIQGASNIVRKKYSCRERSALPW